MLKQRSSAVLDDLTKCEDVVVRKKNWPLWLCGYYILEVLSWQTIVLSLKPVIQHFCKCTTIPQGTLSLLSHTFLHAHKNTHTFSMGCMQDCTYCKKSCWSLNTGAGIMVMSPTCDARRGGRLLYPSPLSQPNTACGIFLASSVSRARAETPRWRCVIARYCMLK